MSQYFAAALARTADGWTGREVDLDDVDDFDIVTDLLRDLADGPGPALLLLEEDDEYVAVVRADANTDTRVFLSDRRSVGTSDIARMLYEAVETPEEGEVDEEETVRPQAEPFGDTDLLADLGTDAARLVDLCSQEGLLPADVLTMVCERAGCEDVLEGLREG